MQHQLDTVSYRFMSQLTELNPTTTVIFKVFFQGKMIIQHFSRELTFKDFSRTFQDRFNFQGISF